ncbi:hypothetical protein ONZ45_g18303 [Pleurotus djamor]|nr:hypothetical protein ONZ45_g18303 [Pleurotus djamor]
MVALSNELLERIHNLLPIWETQTFHNACRHHYTILPHHPRIRPVSDSIRPFFNDVEGFRRACLLPFDCLIGGVIPFLTLAGLPPASYDIMDLFVTSTDGNALCTAMEALGCKFFVNAHGTTPASLIISSANKYLDDLMDSDWNPADIPPPFQPPHSKNDVAEQDTFPGPPRLGSTATRRFSIDPTLVILPVLMPQGRWIRVHVLKYGYQAIDAVYIMPSTLYLHFISHDRIFSFSFSLTFTAGLHVPFNRHLLFMPIPWPPPFSFKCLNQAQFERISGQALRFQMWTKSWDGAEGSMVDPPRHELYGEASFQVEDIGKLQSAGDEGPSLGVSRLYNHPEISSTSEEISWDTELDVGIMPTTTWW